MSTDMSTNCPRTVHGQKVKIFLIHTTNDIKAFFHSAIILPFMRLPKIYRSSASNSSWSII